MPRDGSTRLPAGVTPAEPMSIGEVADPPFAILPKTTNLFKVRAARFRTLAEGHPIGEYLTLLATVSSAQHEIATDLADPPLPAAERLEEAYRHTMPPLSAGQVELADHADRVFVGLLDHLASTHLNPETAAVVTSLRGTGLGGTSLGGAGPDERRAMMRAVVNDEVPEAAIAGHVLAAAALQVYMSALARQLDVARLARVADGACPACGGAPVSSAIVGWDGAHGARFCTCSICATQWNVSRIKCLACGSEKGISYQSIEGGDGHISGETCESCTTYVKMMHQHKSPQLDPVADDVATLALDLTLEREGWRRASVNPFLMGY